MIKKYIKLKKNCERMNRKENVNKNIINDKKKRIKS